MTETKHLFSKVALLTFILSTSLVVQAADKVVNVYNWSNYIDEEILKEFTAKTGIKVIYDVFDSNEIVETKLLSGATGYDVVVPTHNFLGRQIKAGVFQKLDKSKLPNLKHMSKDIEEKMAEFDPNNDYSVNYMWGTAGLGYNEDKIKERMPDAPVNSWALIFDPEIASKFQDCGIYWADTTEVMMPSALAYLGLNPTSQKKEDLEKATDLMLKARSTVRKFDSSEYITSLANGDICISVGYSGDVLQARDRADEAKNGVKVHYIVPKEGGQLWFDQMTIPVDAPHIDTAHTFINYMMQPEVIAKATNFVAYANGNKDADPFINPDILSDKGIYPDAETRKNLWVQGPITNKIQRIVNRMWTKIQTGI